MPGERQSRHRLRQTRPSRRQPADPRRLEWASQPPSSLGVSDLLAGRGSRVSLTLGTPEARVQDFLPPPAIAERYRMRSLGRRSCKRRWRTPSGSMVKRPSAARQFRGHTGLSSRFVRLVTPGRRAVPMILLPRRKGSVPGAGWTLRPPGAARGHRAGKRVTACRRRTCSRPYQGCRGPGCSPVRCGGQVQADSRLRLTGVVRHTGDDPREGRRCGRTVNHALRSPSEPEARTTLPEPKRRTRS